MRTRIMSLLRLPDGSGVHATNGRSQPAGRGVQLLPRDCHRETHGSEFGKRDSTHRIGGRWAQRGTHPPTACPVRKYKPKTAYMTDCLPKVRRGPGAVSLEMEASSERGVPACSQPILGLISTLLCLSTSHRAEMVSVSGGASSGLHHITGLRLQS